jgi:hypothetical protein
VGVISEIIFSVVAPGNLYIWDSNYLSNFNYDSIGEEHPRRTPLVSGIASLLLSQDSTRSPAQIKFIIESTAEDLVGDTSEDKLGMGSNTMVMDE